MKPEPEDGMEADALEFRRLADEFLAAYNATDLERICALLADGAVLMPPSEPTVNGVEDIRGRFEAFFTGFTFNLKFYPAQTSRIGELGFERGSYAASALLKEGGGEPRGGYGEYLLIFERQVNGQWRIGAFGTAAAGGTPPPNIAGPARLATLMEAATALEENAWQEQRTDPLNERYASRHASQLRSAFRLKSDS